jgi:D-3-phosphoglycerate dehydrogenase
VTPIEACESLRTLPLDLKKQVELFPTFGRVSDTNKLAALLCDKDAVVLDIEPVNAEVVKNCRSLKVISRFGEGCDAIDIRAVNEAGIRVTRTRSVSSIAVARHALALIMAMTHNVVENDKNLKKGIWKRKPNMPDSALTLAIIGFGSIGHGVAELAHDLGFKVVVCSRRRCSDKRFKFVKDINDVVKMADIISLHLPLTPKTKHFMSGRLLRQCKNKFIVNTARGALIDERELLSALDKSEIKGYATDVFMNEPVIGLSKKLAQHPKVLGSPHVAAFDKATAAGMIKRAIENALYCLNGMHNKVVSYV